MCKAGKNSGGELSSSISFSEDKASVLKNLAGNDDKLVDIGREDLTAFLTSSTVNGYAPQTGVIT